MRMKNLIVAAVVAGVWSVSGSLALAQDSFDEDVKLFRKDIRSQKKQIIAANMDLTDEEAQQFWPIYDQYTAELAGLWDAKFALLKEYAENYTFMNNEQAESYITGRAAVEESIMQLRLKYFPVFRKVLSGKSTALFFQMDWRISLIVDLQLASQIPLIQP
jgi:Spy/CpxP family protein refolding chaperone